MSSAQQFDRFVLAGSESVAPLFRGRGPLIYVLEFADGEFYVGQTVNMMQRFTSHQRTWGDITAIQLQGASLTDLNRIERDTIGQYRAMGRVLRNRSHNFGHAQPTALDDIVPVVDQKHWVLGQGTYDRSAFEEPAGRPSGPEPKMFKSTQGRMDGLNYFTVADAIVADLAAVIAEGIPDAVSTEQTYWTISDYPSTGPFGRMVTLNTGVAEVLSTSRRFQALTLTDGREVEFVPSYLNIMPDSGVPDDAPWVLEVYRSMQYFRTTPVDRLMIPAGQVGDALQFEPLKLALRELVLKLMRSGTPTRWGRFHSMELARRAYCAIVS
ncbi:MAG TPA: GIY-YIG nuclease family protein [Intrasporangiaceae bacterium]|nr:GIY-YIG nuclease family protein [Intrasporangiaceae bacterium]